MSDSTIRVANSGKALIYRGFAQRPPPFPPRFARERIAKLPQNLGENEGTLFTGRSAKGWIVMLLPGQYQSKGGLVNAAGVADAEMALHLPPKVLKNELVHHSHISRDRQSSWRSA
jgi:hypothetical protein